VLTLLIVALLLVLGPLFLQWLANLLLKMFRS